MALVPESMPVKSFEGKGFKDVLNILGILRKNNKALLMSIKDNKTYLPKTTTYL